MDLSNKMTCFALGKDITPNNYLNYDPNNNLYINTFKDKRLCMTIPINEFSYFQFRYDNIKSIDSLFYYVLMNDVLQPDEIFYSKQLACFIKLAKKFEQMCCFNYNRVKSARK